MTDSGSARAPSAQVIRDAASILLIDRRGSKAHVLMGRRHEGNIFLPGKWVFPGGRVEPSDGDFATATPLNPADMAALLDALPVPAGSTFAHAVAFAAVRELFEETGHAMALPNSEAIQKFKT